MLIDNFINRIGTRKMTINQLSEKMKILKFDIDTHKKLVEGEHFFYSEPETNITFDTRLKTKIFTPYIVEKFIVYSGTKKDNKNTKLFLGDIFNAFFESGNLGFTDSYIEKVFFFHSYEQFTLQERNYITLEMYRLLKLYSNMEEVHKYIQESTGLSLEKIFVLNYILMSFIHSERKQIQVINKSMFKQYIKRSCRDIGDEDVNLYFEFIGINREEFIKKYDFLRMKKNEKGAYEKLESVELQKIDKFLPKVSYQYPLLQIDQSKENYLLTSYTSFTQFLKQERIFYYIYENIPIKHFKSKIHGLAINDYIKEFAKENCNSIRVFGDEVYKPKKSLKYDAPDVIIEFDDYVIFIESKSRPFNLLEAMHDYDKYNFERINKDCFTSIVNIERYINYVNKFNGKKIIRLLSYFFPNSVMVATSSSKVRPIKKIHKDELLVVNLRAIELFLNIKSKPHTEIIEDYVNAVNNHEIDSLYTFLERNYKEESIIDLVEKDKENLIKKYLIS